MSDLLIANIIWAFTVMVCWPQLMFVVWKKKVTVKSHDDVGVE